MEVTLDTKDLVRVEKLLEGVPKGVSKALARATNEALAKCKTLVSRTVRASYNVKAGEVASTLTVVKASPGNLTGYLNYRGVRFPLKRFQVGSGHPVTIQELKGKRTTLSSAFDIAKFDGNIFVRKTEKRFPIKKLTGMGIPQMVSGQRLGDTITDQVQAKFSERALHAAQVIADNFNNGKTT
jgi:hypothetical protein